MNRKVLTILLGIMILFFVFFPELVCDGAKRGLLLWFDTVLPALLPFMILSDFLVRQNITECISRVTAPLFTRIFGLSQAGCYPAVIGFLSGYPIGARTAAQLYKEKAISKEEAQYLLTFCNNASPMFLLEYMGIHCMGLRYPVLALGTVYLSAFLASFFWRGQVFENIRQREKRCTDEKCPIIISLDESILDAFVTITKIGGYIILFSILAGLSEALLPLPQIIKYIGMGILEITTGGEALAGAEVLGGLQNCILLSLTAFGGFSSVAQTASVIGETDLSVGRYLLAKLLQAALAFLIAFVGFCLLSLTA